MDTKEIQPNIPMEEQKVQNCPLFSSGDTESKKFANELISSMLDKVVTKERDFIIKSMVNHIVDKAV